MNGATLPSLDKTRRYRPVCSCGEAPVGNVLRGGRWVEAPWCPRCAPTSAVMNDWRHATVEFSGRRRNVPFALLRGVECAGCDEERRVGKPCPQHYALGRTAQEAAEMVERWEQIVAEEGEPEPALRPWRLDP